MNVERRTILFSGRVQGVGFRMTAVQLAEDLTLAGTVRNSDGRSVELVVEGPREDIETLISRLREHFGSFIRRVEYGISAPIGMPGPGIRVIF